MHYLVTATLCLAMAPRSQVLKEMRIGTTFVKESDGRYWIKMSSEKNKNGKPTLFALPAQLTEYFDFYLTHVRPRLLDSSEVDHQYVFCKKSGKAPRTDFSELTTTVRQQLIGRPVNAHAFRSALITTFYNGGATQSDMDKLASIMAHDSTTARNYYFRSQMAQASLDTSQRIIDLLHIAESPNAAHA